MGQRIEDPPEPPGTDCPSCTPARWPVGETPEHVYIYFEGMFDCGWSPHPAPNGQTFKLDQVPGFPCWWRHVGDPWEVDFYAKFPGFIQSRIFLKDHHGFSFFLGLFFQCPLEYASYTNQQALCLFQYAASGGTATVFWSTVIAELMEGFGITPPSQVFYELFKAPAAAEVHKLTNLYQRTNIKIKT